MSDIQWSEWIEWNGKGKTEVFNNTQVEVKYQSGEVESDLAQYFRWGYDNDETDIVAYRYPLPVESGIAHADEDECIQLACERMNQKEDKYSAYFKDVRHIDTLDVYRVIDLFGCEKHGHPISHAVKKLLLSGARTGGKDIEYDIREAIDSLHRWLEMREEDRV